MRKLVWNHWLRWYNIVTNSAYLSDVWPRIGCSDIGKGCELYEFCSLFCIINSILILQIPILKFIINEGDVYNKRSQYLL